MIAALGVRGALLIDIVCWTVLGVAIGLHFHRKPAELLSSDGWLTRIRGWEAGGDFYRRLKINAWKDRLPEAGALFRGGTSKRSLPGFDRASLERFATETRRAERVHWWLLAAGPLYLLWNPASLAVVMLGYALFANLPFIAVQRYNRARIERALVRKQRTS